MASDHKDSTLRNQIPIEIWRLLVVAAIEIINSLARSLSATQSQEGCGILSEKFIDISGPHDM